MTILSLKWAVRTSKKTQHMMCHTSDIRSDVFFSYHHISFSVIENKNGNKNQDQLKDTFNS